MQSIALSLLRDRERIGSLDQFRAFAFRRLAWLRLAEIEERRHEVAFDEDVHEQAAETADPLAEELHVALAQAIGALPTTQRMVLEAHLEGQSVREIAAKLGVTEATVRSHSRHARLKLAQALSEFAQSK